ncbi:MAG: endo-1,4-beta-xylanase [Clostridiales bacterium]|nr:endo-1,4-beta-xylanase [Clostridiales bacterium]
MNMNHSHRISSRLIRVTDREGKPLSNKQVTFELIKHEFLFGCGAGDAVDAANPSGDPRADAIAKDRFEKWLKIFNFGTTHFYWDRFEPKRGEPMTDVLMRGARLLRKNGAEVKGHPLCWHTLAPDWLLDLSEDEILRELLARIERDVTDFKGVIDMWDVINEVVIMPVFDKYDNGITRLCKKIGRFGIVDQVFRKARECNPGSTLLLNDFNTSPAFEILIEGLLDKGVPIDVIGIQSHQHQGYWGREKLEEVLERFERFGLPIHFTENTFVSGELMPPEIEDLNDFVVDSWPSTPEFEQRQAENIREMYSVLFAHPLVQGITQWDFADGYWLGAPSGVVRSDGTIKPAYEMLDRLVNHEWSSTLSARTNEDGEVELNGYRGEYRVTCANHTGNITLGDGTASHVLKATVTL